MASDCCMCSLSISQIRHGCFPEISGMLIIIRNKLISYHLHLTGRMKYSETHSHQPERPFFVLPVCKCCNSLLQFSIHVPPLHHLQLLHLVLKRSKALCKLVTITCFKTTEHTGVVDRVRCWNIHYLKIHFKGIQDISTLISS